MRTGLGIDVGGTFTDVVLIDMDTREVLRSAKSRTTNQDLSLGIERALDKLDKNLVSGVTLVSLSTTLATNALVEGVRRPIASILIGYREEHCPQEFCKDSFLVQGGHNVSGEEVAPLDQKELLKIIEKTKNRVQAYAVAGYFSSRNPDHEIRVKELIQRETDIPVVCGHELSLKLNAVVRATTTILNAHLIPIIRELLVSVRSTLVGFGVEAPLMVVKGDGTLVREKIALLRPVETVLSGPAASVIGARHLIRNVDGITAVVVDTGGTTTDIALLENGMPGINYNGVRVGQWQTNVAAINTLAIGLGGDSHIYLNGSGHLDIGPRRVTPLSILAHQFPQVTQELARIAENPTLSAKYSPGDHWLSHRKGGQENLTPNQKLLLSLVRKDPQSTIQLAEKLELHPTLVLEEIRPIEQLGLVLHSGLTPTDIFHTMGVYSRGNREAATYGTAILARQMELASGDLCVQIKRLINKKLGLKILHRLSRGNHDYLSGMEKCPCCQAVWDNCFAEATGGGRRSPSDRFSVQIRLEEQIIGLGGPAHILIPPLAERLGTECMVPPYAEVANALGAISGIVMATREVRIVPGELGRIVLFSQDHRGVYRSLEEANREAKRFLRKSLLEEATKAGASNVDVKIEEHTNWAKTGFGDVLIEQIITGRAIGSPILNGEDAPVGKEP